MQSSGTTLQLVYEIGLRRLGRRRLAESTGLSEMTVRLELERLRERRLVDLRRAGPRLTLSGRAHFARLFEAIRDVRPLLLDTLRLDVVGLAAHIRSEAVPPAWVARDIAIREGATGLILLRLESAEWAFTHDAEPIRLRNPVDASTLDEAFRDLAERDHLVVSFGSSRLGAGRGLWSALAQILSS